MEAVIGTRKLQLHHCMGFMELDSYSMRIEENIAVVSVNSIVM